MCVCVCWGQPTYDNMLNYLCAVHFILSITLSLLFAIVLLYNDIHNFEIASIYAIRNFWIVRKGGFLYDDGTG